jgi:23S rRNA (pseudouridine1915-N3)-methyltransferase
VRISIVTPGRTRSDYLRTGEADFLSRLERYTRVSVIAVRETRITENRPVDEVLEQEWRRLAEAVPARSYVVALDRRGKMLSSEELAEQIRVLQNRSVEDACFVIGGPAGLSGSAIRAAHFVLSFSPMTFTHEMSRLILLEQLYRAFTILRHEKYHK